MTGNNRPFYPFLIENRSNYRKNRRVVPFQKQGGVLPLLQNLTQHLLAQQRRKFSYKKPLQLFLIFSDNILHHRIYCRDQPLTVQTDYSAEGIIQEGFHLGRCLFLHLHGIVQALRHRHSLTHGIFCGGKKQGGNPCLCGNGNCRISSNHQIHTVLHSPLHSPRKLRPLLCKIHAQINPVKLVKIRHITEHIPESHYSNNRPRFLHNLSGSHHQKSHLLRCQNNFHYRNIGVLLDQGCLKSSGNDNGCPVRYGFSGLHNCILRRDYPHSVNGIFFLLQYVVGLMKHFLSGHQKYCLSHLSSILPVFSCC